ncbi:MAG TPA: SirB2 family protein [Rhodocyclaceae bacterium]|nr:SirB2 family protein [Rhodocyclaceae bacterium]
MDYTRYYMSIKHVHITCVALSISLFTLRGTLQLAGVEWRRWRVLRIAPHIVDSVLLGSAIGLAMTLHQYPFVNGWLTAKLLALFAYVWLGKRALGTDARGEGLVWFAAALLTVAYIVGVAVTHSPSWRL